MDALEGRGRGSWVVVHHDPSHNPAPPGWLTDRERVHVLAAEPIRWGHFTSIEAFARAARWAEAELDYDWLVLLSGQDYPIKPLAAIEATLAVAPFDGFLRTAPPPSRRKSSGATDTGTTPSPVGAG